MKQRTAPTSPSLLRPEDAGTNLSRKPFNWKLQCEKALKHQMQRAIDLARCNPDYQIKYPNECRDNPDHKVLPHCHPEAQERLLESHEKILKLAIVPDVDRPKRLNRVG